MEFRKIGVGWSLSDVVMSWLRLQTHLKSIPHPFHIYKVFNHLDMPWMGIWVRCYACAGQGSRVDFRKIELSPSPSDVVMSWLRLQTRLECIPHPCHIYTVFQHLDMPWMGIWGHPLHLHCYTCAGESGFQGKLGWGGA